MGGQPQARGADLEARRPQGAPKAAEALKAVAQRQVVRATATAVSQPRMDIRQIFARSPPAKGRVERTAGTFQDRLVTELRLARVETINGANEVPYRYPIL